MPIDVTDRDFHDSAGDAAATAEELGPVMEREKVLRVLAAVLSNCGYAGSSITNLLQKVRRALAKNGLSEKQKQAAKIIDEAFRIDGDPPSNSQHLRGKW